MNSATLQLFSLDEILDRIGRNRLTGSCHIFTPKDSANIFFKEGLVIAAFNGLFEGEDVVRKVLDWKGAQSMWQPNATMATPAQKPLKLNINEFLAKVRPALPPLTPGSVSTEFSLTRSGPFPDPAEETDSPLQALPASKNASIVEVEPVQAQPVDLSATKNIMPTENDRAAREEALLRKYKLMLVSVDSPHQKLHITRISSLIGRNPACDITIVHPSISRQHCLLQMTDRGLHVKDLDTTNGTKVNGIMMKEGYINADDKLTVGHLVFVLEKE